MLVSRNFLVAVMAVLSFSSDAEEWVSVTYPLYRQCDGTFERMHANLQRLPSLKGRYQHSVQEFGAAPGSARDPYGAGVISVPKDADTSFSDPRRLLNIHIESVYMDCLPNNAFDIGDSLADLIVERTGADFCGKVAEGTVWVYFNDQHYTYPEN